MPLTLIRPVIGALVALAVVAAPAAAERHDHSERLVLRGDATAVDGPCDASGCAVRLDGGRFRSSTLGSGGYDGDITLAVADAFPNGEGGICAPLKARIVLGAGTPDRLVLAVRGDSCQDAAGPLEAASFTGLARFAVRSGTGRYRHASGGGLATFAEDAANHHRITLVGRVAGS